MPGAVEKEGSSQGSSDDVQSQEANGINGNVSSSGLSDNAIG